MDNEERLQAEVEELRDKLARVRETALMAGSAYWQFAQEFIAIVDEGNEGDLID